MYRFVGKNILTCSIFNIFVINYMLRKLYSLLCIKGTTLVGIPERIKMRYSSVVFLRMHWLHVLPKKNFGYGMTVSPQNETANFV